MLQEHEAENASGVSGGSLVNTKVNEGRGGDGADS